MHRKKKMSIFLIYMFHEHKHAEQDLLEEMMREERSEESGAQKELLISRGCLDKREVWVEGEM